MNFWDELRAWSKFCRDNFSTLLLVAWSAAFVGLILHESHDKADVVIAEWTKTQAAGIFGALIFALTGREKDKLANKAEDTEHPDPPVQTVDMHVETPAAAIKPLKGK